VTTAVEPADLPFGSCRRIAVIRAAQVTLLIARVQLSPSQSKSKEQATLAYHRDRTRIG
jgi:hypothetical protein